MGGTLVELLLGGLCNRCKRDYEPPHKLPHHPAPSPPFSLPPRAAPGAASAQFHADRRHGAVQRRLPGRRGLAFVAPLAALLLSDLMLGFYAGMGFVYASTALVVLIGWWVSSRRSIARVAMAAVAGSVSFFIITNFGMWLFSGFYPATMRVSRPGLPA